MYLPRPTCLPAAAERQTACASYLLGCKTPRLVRRRRSARRPRRRVHRARRGAGRPDRAPCSRRTCRPTTCPGCPSSSSAPARRPICRRAPASSSSITPLADGEVVTLGNTEIQAIATPGHALAHHAYVVTDRTRGDEPWFVLTGDALLVGDAGRPDLHAHGEHTVEEMARTLYRSLTERLLALARPPRALPGALLGLGLRPRAVGQPGLDDRLRAPPQPGAAVRVRGRVRRRRCCRTSRPRRSSRRRSSPPTAPGGPLADIDERGAGPARAARERRRSSRCSSRSTRSSARWSASSARRCRSIGRDDFGLGSSAAVLSFIVAFGLAKAFTNLGAGALAERAGRRRLLIAGWAVALPVPLLIAIAPSWGWIVAANVLLGRQPGARVVHDRRDEDRPRRPAAPRVWRSASTRRPATAASRWRPAVSGWLAAAVRRPRRARRRRRRDRGHRVHALACCSSATPPRTSRSSRPAHPGRATRPPPRLREAFAPASYRGPRCAHARRPASSTTSTTALAWGLVPLFLAAHGAGAGQVGLVAADLSRRLGRRADRHRPLVGQRRPQAADRRGHARCKPAALAVLAGSGGRVGIAAATRRSCSGSVPRSSTRR